MKQTAMLFCGQGSQHVGMMRTLLRDYPTARKTFEEAEDYLNQDLRRLCSEGPAAELTQTANHPVLFTASMAAYRVFMEEVGHGAAWMAGHSIGEVTALTAAGAFRFCDGLEVVRRRGQWMEEAAANGIGGMMVVKKFYGGAVLRRLSDWVSIEDAAPACLNAPDVTVVSGKKTVLSELAERFRGLGADVVEIDVNVPSHGPMMAPAAEKLTKLLADLPVETMHTPVIANLTGLPYSDAASVRRDLPKQLCAPVRWTNTMTFFKRAGVTRILEMGPEQVLQKLVRKNAPLISTFPCGKSEDITALRDILVPIKVPRDNLVTRCLAAAVATPNRNDDAEVYREQVLPAYAKLRELADNLEDEARQPSNAEKRRAVDLLQQIFDVKQVNEEERHHYLAEYPIVLGYQPVPA